MDCFVREGREASFFFFFLPTPFLPQNKTLLRTLILSSLQDTHGRRNRKAGQGGVLSAHCCRGGVLSAHLNLKRTNLAFSV